MAVPRRIFCLWIGGQPMSRSRDDALYTIRQNTGVRVELITDDELENYILPEHPLHPAYEYLTHTIKVDYLRAYLMHYYGGGYTDIKYTFSWWGPVFDDLSNNPTKWCVGYNEMGRCGVAQVEDTELQQTLYDNWEKLIGNGAYIFKPNTPFTKEWLEGVEKKMDDYLPMLKQHPPKHNRDAKGAPLPDGSMSMYPIPWGGLHAAIFHPLCYKYQDRLLYSLLCPILVGYI